MSSERGFIVFFILFVALATWGAYRWKSPAPQIYWYDKSIKDHKLDCLALRLNPPDHRFETFLKQHYRFDATCPYRLEVTYKRGIVCNSSFNTAQKTLHGMPHSFLHLSVRKGLRLVYSYYIDIDDRIGTDDLQKGFKRLYRDVIKR